MRKPGWMSWGSPADLTSTSRRKDLESFRPMSVVARLRSAASAAAVRHVAGCPNYAHICRVAHLERIPRPVLREQDDDRAGAAVCRHKVPKVSRVWKNAEDRARRAVRRVLRPHSKAIACQIALRAKALWSEDDHLRWSDRDTSRRASLRHKGTFRTDRVGAARAGRCRGRRLPQIPNP